MGTASGKSAKIGTGRPAQWGGPQRAQMIAATSQANQFDPQPADFEPKQAAAGPRWQQLLADAITDPGELCALLDLDPAPGFAGHRGGARASLCACLAAMSARMRRGDPNDPLLLQVLPHGRGIAASRWLRHRSGRRHGAAGPRRACSTSITAERCWSRPAPAPFTAATVFAGIFPMAKSRRSTRAGSRRWNGCAPIRPSAK